MNSISPNGIDVNIKQVGDNYQLTYTEYFDKPCFDAINATKQLMDKHGLTVQTFDDSSMTIKYVGTKDEIGKLLIGEFLGWCDASRARVLETVSTYLSTERLSS